jgi:3-hydroxy-9,10-secoandrosta-1,3,5(10)-triene-9,17-dione monooxygenase
MQTRIDESQFHSGNYMNAPPNSTGFAGVSREEALRRAADLIPLLRENAAAAENVRRLAPAVREALHRSGLFRYRQPKSRGGMELDFVAWTEIPEMLARGDCSTAWNVANLASHHRTLAQFSKEAQDEVWNENPDALIAAGIAYPQGRATKVDGGLRLSGTWNFCSAVTDSTWNMLACMVMENDKPVDWVQCLLRDSEYTIIDDWQTMGMRGTGSCTVKVENLFVPQYRVQSMATALPGHRFAGVAENPNPLYVIPTSAVGGHGLAGCVVGNAQGALDATIDWIKSRSTLQGAKMRDFQTVQLRIGMAGAKIDAARLVLRNDCIEAEAATRAGRAVSVEEKLRYKRNAAIAVKFSMEAIDLLQEMAGANGIYQKVPLERMFRDARSAGAHIHFSIDMQMTQWGLVASGGEFKSPTL